MKRGIIFSFTSLLLFSICSVLLQWEAGTCKEGKETEQDFNYMILSSDTLAIQNVMHAALMIGTFELFRKYF